MILYEPKRRKLEPRENKANISKLYDKYKEILDKPFKRKETQWLKWFTQKLIG